ncbi:GGDEF domain-containing protein [Mangrovitalea sediminis]|uniref:GGDEF domain-containing protein n=1 Tax=Mangrovitalea sediminis TaxID=1982043 RepID=UPI000BE59997|nr:GGDEF domain-containing protein [Mangrovitalea sediminis]
MNSPEEWKAKYLRQLEESELREKAWREERNTLQRLLVRTSLAADGMAPALDKALAELRAFLRDEHLDVERLKALQGHIDDMVVQLDEQRHQRLERLTGILQRLLGTLEAQTQERQHRRDLKALSREIAHTEPSVTLLPEWLARLSAIQAAVLQAGPERETAANSWRRWFGRHESPSTSGPTESELPGAVPSAMDAAAFSEATSLDTTPLSEAEVARFARQVNQLVQQLLAQVTLPAEAEAEARRLQSSLSESHNWADIQQALDTIAGLIIAAVSYEQREFETFLQRLDERLSTIQSHIQAQRDSQEDSRSASAALDLEVQGELQAIGRAVSEAGDLGSLKMSIGAHVERIGQSLSRFREDQAKREVLAHEHVSALEEKLAALEAQTEHMRRQLQEERSRALTDILTGLPNREAWQERLVLEYERWRRYRQPVSMAVIDIDHFKRINDEYGHLAGDKAIRLIGRALRDRLRTADFVARFGGEEFVILLPETDVDTAFKVIEALREHIGALPFHFRKQHVSITLSAGLVGFAGDAGADQLFEMADKALYSAKQQGRNRVVRADASVENNG